MKGIVTACIIALSLAVVPGGVDTRLRAQEPEGAAAAHPSDSGWSGYSYGLFHKYAALQSDSAEERLRGLDRAIEYFKGALTGDGSDGRVYDQLSECYYHKEDFDRAVEYARKAIGQNSRRYQPYLRIYRICLARGEYQKAAETLEEYCASSPNSVPVKYELGEHYFNRMKDMKKARQTFGDIIELSQRRPVSDYYRKNAYIYLGFVAYREMKVRRSLRYFRRAHRIDRGDLEALFFLSQVSMLLNEVGDAEKYAAMYLERNDSNDQVHSVMGKILYMKEDPRAVYHLGRVRDMQNIDGILAAGLYCERLGDDERALALLALALKYQAKEIPAHLALARIHMKKNETELAFKRYLSTGVLMYSAKMYGQAVVNLERADAIKENVPEVKYYLGRACEADGSYAAAIRHYRAVNIVQGDSSISLHIGYLYGLLKNYDAAMKRFNDVIAREPKNPQAYFFSGLISIWRERYLDAERSLKRAVALERTQEPYYFYLAVAMEKTNRLGKAIDYLKQAIVHDDKSARSYNYLGYLYADNNMELDRSMELITRALQLDPGNGAYLDSLGWLHYRRGEYRQALEKLLLAERILDRSKSPDPVVYEHIGDTYRMMREDRRAIEYWHRSVMLEKNAMVEQKIRLLQKKRGKERR
ncbi:MAG: tetratricopeptide repeat protein [Spirochaetes bacterium]|nr:tetratricopeptide repeat protein [Spirochaetota bacterium]